MITDVFILAAGLGTRLRPLTEHLPKPLVEINSKPLIGYHLERLQREGFKRVMINLHYMPEKIRQYVGNGDRWGLDVSYSYEPELLDTGGGIKNIESWIKSDNLLVINSDSFFEDSLLLKILLSSHLARSPKMTLLVCPGSQSYTPLYTDRDDRLVGFGNDYFPSNDLRLVTYLGVMVLSCKLLSTMPPVGIPFSLTSGIIPKLLLADGEIRTVRYEGFWSDIGTPERLEEASKFFRKK